MPSVLGFWWFPDEEQAFLEYLTRDGPLMALRWEGEVIRNPDRIVASTLGSIIEGNPGTILFTREHFANQLVIAEGNDAKGACYGASPERSLFIIYDRASVSTGQRLRMANLVAHAKYVKDGAFVDKPLEFVKWYKRVFRWVQARTEVLRGYRVTPRVAKAVGEGWRLVP